MDQNIQYHYVHEKELCDFFDVYREDFYERIKYTDGCIQPAHFLTKRVNHFVFATIGKKVVGVSVISLVSKTPEQHDGWDNWLSSLAVDPDYQKKGIATGLADSTFAKLSELGVKKFLISGYSDDGYHFLRKVLHRAAEKHSVVIMDEDKIKFPKHENTAAFGALKGVAA